MSQRRDWEDTECRQIFRLCVLQISVLNPAVHGKFRLIQGKANTSIFLGTGEMALSRSTSVS